jgi:organic radical activating enzyme
MKTDFEHCESLYWVFTQLCNDKCDHCYNLSGPKGERISEEECLQIIENLPSKIDRIILSGGEPLAEKKKLYLILDELGRRYSLSETQIMLQTNGDLLTEQILDTLIEKGVTRFDIASIDRYHKFKGEKLDALRQLFESRKVSDENTDPLIDKSNYLERSLTWGYWGATEDMWLGGNWARGRAMKKNIWKKDPHHNFCKIMSGARNFLGGYEDIPQEISIQLWKINPCCPGTLFPIGDARTEKVSEVLKRTSEIPAFQALNEGDPLKMAMVLGMDREKAEELLENSQNICLFCDQIYPKI